MTDKHTPGPWVWRGNAHAQDVYLSTRHGGRRIVMGFKRWGMAGAQPTFRGQNSLEDAKDLLKFEVGDPSVTGVAEARENNSVYRLHIADIDHPDARLIEAAPEMWDLIVVGVFLAFTTGDEELTAEEVEWREKAVALIAKVRGTQ
jgi:hypothetical protein